MSSFTSAEGPDAFKFDFILTLLEPAVKGALQETSPMLPCFCLSTPPSIHIPPFRRFLDSEKTSCVQLLNGSSILTGPTDEHWKQVRKGVAPSFSTQHMRYVIHANAHHNVNTSIPEVSCRFLK